jgi:hypothetical protein
MRICEVPKLALDLAGQLQKTVTADRNRLSTSTAPRRAHGYRRAID